MSTAALQSQGTLIKIWRRTDSPPEFATFAQVKTINGPSGNANVIDVSDLQSTMKEKSIGLPDWGNMSLDLFVVPQDPNFIYVKDAYVSRTRERFELTFTDSNHTVWLMYGYVSHIGVSIGVDQPVNGTITIEIDGDIEDGNSP